MQSDSLTSSEGSRRGRPTTMFVDTGAMGWTDSVSFAQREAEEPAVVVVRISVHDGERWLEEQIAAGGSAPVTESERRRADRMLDGGDATAHLVGRAVVRATLSAVGEEGASVCLSRDDHGRPVARESQFDFNITHAGGWVVVAFSSNEAGGRVGVDLEEVGRRTSRPRQTNLTGEVLSDRERAWLERVSEEQAEGSGRARREVYEVGLMHLWTVKEAVLKQTGRGLRQDPRAVGCEFRDGGNPGIAGVRGIVEKYWTGGDAVTPSGPQLEGLSVTSFAIDDDYVGAVVHAKSAPVRFAAFDEWEGSIRSNRSSS